MGLLFLSSYFLFPFTQGLRVDFGACKQKQKMLKRVEFELRRLHLNQIMYWSLIMQYFILLRYVIIPPGVAS